MAVTAVEVVTVPVPVSPAVQSPVAATRLEEPSKRAHRLAVLAVKVEVALALKVPTTSRVVLGVLFAPTIVLPIKVLVAVVRKVPTTCTVVEAVLLVPTIRLLETIVELLNVEVELTVRVPVLLKICAPVHVGAMVTESAGAPSLRKNVLAEPLTVASPTEAEGLAPVVVE